jgi:peptide/nickel transport system permease protein
MVARRLGFTIFLLLGISLLTFIISHCVPGDPVATLLGERGTEAQIANLRHQLGLDRPLPVQYAHYVWDLLHMDLGQSLRTRRPVLDDLVDYFPATVELSTTALFIALLLGIPLGVAGALGHNRWPDHLTRVGALTGVSTPIFWLGLLCLRLFYSRWDLLPPGGRIGDYVDPPVRHTGLLLVDALWDHNGPAFLSGLQHLLLPAACLSVVALASMARLVRSQMLEVLSQDYVRTAIAGGLRYRTVIFRYALKNALLPAITAVGLQYGSLLSGAVLTETIFSWPGIGKYAVGSMVNLDFPALMGVTLLIAVTYSLVNLAVDLIYVFVDPRLRSGRDAS